MKLSKLGLAVFILFIAGLSYGQFYTIDQVVNKVLDKGISSLKVTITSGTVTISVSTVNVKIVDSGIQIPVDIQNQTKTILVLDTTTVTNLQTLFKQGQLIGNVSFYAIPFGVYDVSGSTIVIQQPVDVTGSVNNYTQNITTTTDSRYANKISTWTAGRITSATSQTISITDFDTNCFTFYADGGTGEVDSNFGSGLYLPDGIGQTSPKFDIAKSSANFYMRNLSASATYLYFISGVK